MKMHFHRIYRRLPSFFALLAGIILIFSISSSASAGFAGQEKVRHAAVIEKAVRGEVQDLIVVFDDNSAVQRAAAMRFASGANHDTPDILREKSLLFGAKKQEVFDSLTMDDAEVIDDYDHLPMMFLRVKSLKGLQRLSSQSGVTGIYENTIFTPFLAESLPLIGQPAVAAAGFKGAGTAVAVLDTGVDYTIASAFGTCTGGNTPGDCLSLPAAHAGCKVACVHDFAPNDGSPDADGHGTNVSGIVVGVAPDTKIIGLDVFQPTGAAFSDISAAINWVIGSKAAYNIVAINMSFGIEAKKFTSPCPSTTYGLEVDINYAKQAGIAVVVASGNDGFTNGLAYPGCVPSAISVGSVKDGGPAATPADGVSSFSNSASFLTILAPGQVITAAGFSMMGTSQATPHIAGAVAVLKGTGAFPAETPDQTVSRMTSTGKPVFDGRNGITKPRIDLVAAINLTISISGKVVSSKGLPVEGVTIALSGDATAATVTDADGSYSFADVADGSYTVTPSKGSITFTPAQRSVTVNGSSVLVKDFTANVHDITGRVRTASGTPVAGVTVTLSGAADAVTTTDSAGKYSFRQLADGTYTVTPAKAGYTFSPVSKTFSISGADVTGKNFTVITYAIVGYVWTPSGTPMSGVTVSLTGDATKTKTTDSTGRYRFGNLPNGNYVVTPSKTGRAFSPPSRDVVVSGATVTKQNFVRDP